MQYIFREYHLRGLASGGAFDNTWLALCELWNSFSLEPQPFSACILLQELYYIAQNKTLEMLRGVYPSWNDSHKRSVQLEANPRILSYLFWSSYVILSSLVTNLIMQKKWLK